MHGLRMLHIFLCMRKQDFGQHVENGQTALVANNVEFRLTAILHHLKFWSHLQ